MFFLQKMNAFAQRLVFYQQPAPRIKDQSCILVHNGSVKPKIKTVQDSNWKENCPGDQEPPHRLRKASKDVREP